MQRPAERPNRYFTFLRRLRADGRSNMYGAIPYLAAAFGLDRAEAFRIVCEWVDAQEPDSASVRARTTGTEDSPPPVREPVEVAQPKRRKPVKQQAARKSSGKPGRASTPRAA